MKPLRDELIRTSSADGRVSVRVLTSTNLVRDAVRRHATSPIASVALGRALGGGLLLATEAQSGERVQIQLRGDGPLGSVIVTADSEGTVRGYVQNPAVDLPLEGPKLSLARAIGLGTLAVERMHPSWSQPYSGICICSRASRSPRRLRSESTSGPVRTAKVVSRSKRLRATWCKGSPARMTRRFRISSGEWRRPPIRPNSCEQVRRRRSCCRSSSASSGMARSNVWNRAFVAAAAKRKSDWRPLCSGAMRFAVSRLVIATAQSNGRGRLGDPDFGQRVPVEFCSVLVGDHADLLDRESGEEVVDYLLGIRPSAVAVRIVGFE